MAVTGITAGIEIERDSRGVPTLRARDRVDLSAPVAGHLRVSSPRSVQACLAPQGLGLLAQFILRVLRPPVQARLIPGHARRIAGRGDSAALRGLPFMGDSG